MKAALETELIVPLLTELCEYFGLLTIAWGAEAIFAAVFWHFMTSGGVVGQFMTSS